MTNTSFAQQTENSLPSCLLVLRKRVAFTLAEVLITLGIIGVVAALTIPNVIHSYKKKVTEEKLKAAYSIFSQAIKMSYNENGSVEYWTYQNDKDLERYVLPYLKGVKKKSDVKDYYIMNSLSIVTYKYDSWPALNEFKAGTKLFYKMQNGITFVVSLPCQNDKRFDDPHIIVDLNGSKGPNIMGADGFRFSIVAQQGLIPSKRAYVYGGCSTSEVFERYRGGTCSYTIAQNGWKIPDDYPYRY